MFPLKLTATPIHAFSKCRQLLAVLALIATFLPTHAVAQAEQESQSANSPSGTDLTQMSIEDLMSVRVTSVSKTSRELSETASAIFVITQEDIKQSGSTNIPDLLRMVPGMDVAQINSSTWAISARGLNGQYSNELVVLVDGRTVYTPTFGGVYWDTLDMPLEDIERIEVIRGPGGSVWGSNAVNGVVNIVTKKTSETQGGLVVVGAGNIQQGFGTVQYGGTAGHATDYRAYFKFFNDASFLGIVPQAGDDRWYISRAGFRFDSKLSAADVLIVSGDIYAGREDQPTIYLPSVTAPSYIPVNYNDPLTGGFMQSVWNHDFSPHSDTSLKVAFDRYTHSASQSVETRSTFDLDFQHHIDLQSRHDILWGVGYRYTADFVPWNLTVATTTPHINDQLFTSFAQDEIALVKHRVYLTIGAKVERNDYTGFGIMPSGRLSWKVHSHQTLWAAVSRALRTPNLTDTSVRINFGSSDTFNGVPVLLSQFGNPNFQNEVLLAYEAGYRANISNHLSVDVAMYYNAYDKLRSREFVGIFPEDIPAPPHFVEELTYQNLGNGEAHGMEISANWKVASRWTLSPGIAVEIMHMHAAPTSQDGDEQEEIAGLYPSRSAQLRSNLALFHSLTWNTTVYFVDRLPAIPLPSYTRLDTSLIWQVSERAAFSIVGQNLVRDTHVEFNDRASVAEPTGIERSAYAKLAWRF